tara:strand:+ start:3376 stop:3621 length:246 start_codon:yes stop_codon:yes gene_type:complete
MIVEVNLKYKGLDIIVSGDYIEGNSSVNQLDQDEYPEFWINEIDIDKNADNVFLNMKNFIERREDFNDEEIENMCIDKCKK